MSESFRRWPAVAICGWSGSGKTTLILELIEYFRGQGLRVGVIKHDVHGLDVDREGKDSYRFFEAGADVIMRSPRELLIRAHRTDAMELDAVLDQAAPYYDLMLIEGHKATPHLPKIWVLADGELTCPVDIGGVVATLPRGAGRRDAALAVILPLLPKR